MATATHWVISYNTCFGISWINLNLGVLYIFIIMFMNFSYCTKPLVSKGSWMSILVYSVVGSKWQYIRSLVYRISGIFRVGLIFAEFENSLKSRKIDIANNKPYYMFSLRVLEIAKIGLRENLSFLPSGISAKISRHEKFPIYSNSSNAPTAWQDVLWHSEQYLRPSIITIHASVFIPLTYPWLHLKSFSPSSSNIQIKGVLKLSNCSS